MSGGWLAGVVEDLNKKFKGYLQILGSKRMQIQDKNVTVLKASDGINVTWHVLIDEKKADGR